jgi:hypothetical protein
MMPKTPGGLTQLYSQAEGRVREKALEHLDRFLQKQQEDMEAAMGRPLPEAVIKGEPAPSDTVSLMSNQSRMAEMEQAEDEGMSIDSNQSVNQKQADDPQAMMGRDPETLMTEPAIEEIHRPASPGVREFQIPIQVNVDTPSCKITVTTTGVQTRSRTRAQEGYRRELPPAEAEKSKERVREWLDKVPGPTIKPTPEVYHTRGGRTIRKPVIFDPSEEDRRHRELKSQAKPDRDSRGNKEAKETSGETPVTPAQQEQQPSRLATEKEGTSSAKETGAIPKTRARSSRR